MITYTSKSKTKNKSKYQIPKPKNKSKYQKIITPKPKNKQPTTHHIYVLYMHVLKIKQNDTSEVAERQLSVRILPTLAISSSVDIYMY